MPRKSCASAAATSMMQQSNEWVRTSMLMSFAARRKNCLKFTSGDSRSSSLLMTALRHNYMASQRKEVIADYSSLGCLPALAVVPVHLHSMEISPRRGKTVHPAARRAAQEAAAHCRPTHLPCATYYASP